MLTLSERQRHFLISVMSMAVIMSASELAHDLVRYGRFHWGSHILLNWVLYHFPRAVVWACGIVWVGRKFSGSRRYILVAAGTAPITYDVLAPIITSYLTYPLVIIFADYGFKLSPSLGPISRGHLLVRLVFLIVLAGAALLLSVKLWNPFMPPEKASKSDKPDRCKRSHLARIPDASLMSAILVTCILNPAVIVIFIYLIPMSEDPYGYGDAALAMGAGVLVAHCVAYAIAYMWIGDTARNSLVILAKGAFVVVFGFPVTLAFGAAFVSLIVLGEISLDSLGIFMFFGGAFGAIPVAVAALVSMVMTRFVFFKPVDPAPASQPPQSSTP